MAEPKPLLFEVGVEELPSSFVDSALAALPDLVAQKLAQLRLAHGAVRALGTPRRLAVRVDDVADAQTDLDEVVVGPPEGAAYKDGKPTKAAEAFAAKNGVPVESLKLVDKDAKGKPGKYISARRTEKGRSARELLGKAVAETCAAIPFRKSMRWADLDVPFGRPVQWLVVLHGDDVVDATFAGVRSGRQTRGHRFLAPATFDLAGAAAYEDAMREAHVIVDREERAGRMMERVAAAARAAGGTHDTDPYLVDENASLVEEPHVVTGAFDPAFLALPAAVIRSVARGHQKYFCVQKSEDELVPAYVAVVNTANEPGVIAKGNDRVMRARLSDARFFFEEDKKTRLETRAAKLGGIVFHNRLGTVAEKVLRVTAVAEAVARMLALPQETCGHVEMAARLCKADLVSLMVGEFPELQGDMGRAYARHEGLPAPVCDAIRDHYRPMGADGALAPDDVSAVVGLADRLDSLVGCFAVGLAPTGTADPYALRRGCIAILRTLMEGPSAGWARLDLRELLGLAYDELARGGRKLDLSRDETVAKTLDFAADRLRGLLGAGVTADAVMASSAFVGGHAHPVVLYPAYARAKARALAAVVERAEPWLAKAKLVSKRLAGIAREAAPLTPAEAKLAGVSPAKAESDASILELVARVDEETRALTSEDAVRAALAATELTAEKLDVVFGAILVNDPDDAGTPARLGVLAHGARCMLRIADFSRLA